MGNESRPTGEEIYSDFNEVMNDLPHVQSSPLSTPDQRLDSEVILLWCLPETCRTCRSSHGFQHPTPHAPLSVVVDPAQVPISQQRDWSEAEIYGVSWGIWRGARWNRWASFSTWHQMMTTDVKNGCATWSDSSRRSSWGMVEEAPASTGLPPFPFLPEGLPFLAPGRAVTVKAAEFHS